MIFEHYCKPMNKVHNHNVFSISLTFIVTCGFLGKIKYAPGTFGSLAAIPMMYLMFILSSQISVYFIEMYPDVFADVVKLLAFYVTSLLSTIVLFIIGCILSSIYCKLHNKKDPKEIVIDELVGQMLTYIFCTPAVFVSNDHITQSNNTISFYMYILPFILFRFFDIAKPWPISLADQKIKGGFGVMFDDIIASIFAIVFYWAIILI